MQQKNLRDIDPGRNRRVKVKRLSMDCKATVNN